MQNQYVLTGCEMLNEWILKYPKICIATKRGISNGSHFLWFEYGVNMETKEPITHALVNELKSFVNIAYIGNEAYDKLAVVILSDDGMLEFESIEGSLYNPYTSFFI